MYFFFFFKQKTAYEVRISDWSSDVCSSDLSHHRCRRRYRLRARHHREARRPRSARQSRSRPADAAGRDRRRILESFQPAAGRLDLRAGNPSIWGNLVMTTTHIEYLFDSGSQNSYLVTRDIPEIETSEQVIFDHIPVLLGGIFKATGNRTEESRAGKECGR